MLDKTLPLYRVKKLSTVLVTFWFLQLASLIPGNLAKCGVNSICRITSCQQEIVKFMTFLMCDPVYFCFEPFTKYVS